MKVIMPVLMTICVAAGFTYVPMAFNATVFDVSAIKGIVGLHFCGIQPSTLPHADSVSLKKRLPRAWFG